MKKLLVIIMTMVLFITACAFTSCGGNDTESLNDAADYLFQMYKDKEEVTASDYEMLGQVTVADVVYKVTWTIEGTDAITVKEGSKPGFVTIDVPEMSPEEIPYKLIATVSNEKGNTVIKEFSRKIPLYDITTFEEYMAAVEGDNVTVQGIVVAINAKSKGNSRNHLFLADANAVGGYYSYQMDADPITDLGIEVGMTVEVTGPVAPYSGMQEIKGGTARIISTEKTDYAPVDITELFVAGESLKNYVALPVTIKGVEIGSQDLATASSQYLYFKLGEKTAYLRSYITDFPTTLNITVGENSSVSSEDKTTIDTKHAEHFGWQANVTGILVLYNDAPYLIPMSVDCFEYLAPIEKAPEVKVAEALELLSIKTFITENTTLELPLASDVHSDVKFTWTVDKEGYTITDGKIALTVSETPVELKFTVTAACGDKTATKDITVKVSLPNVSIKEAISLEDGASVVLTGVVTQIKSVWNEQYGNMDVYLTDATGTILIFRTTEKLEVGDTIKVTGKVGSYKGDKQIAQGSKVEKLTVSTIAQAIEMADGTEVVLKGTVSSVKSEWNEKYGNMEVYLKDETGELLLYRITNKVAANDKVVVFGKMGSYKGAKQLAQGGSAVVTEAAPAEGGNTEAGTETVDGTKASKTMAELITANNWNNTDTVGQSFTLDSVVSVKIDGGLNSGKAYNGDHIRIYATDTPAGSITISVADGYELVSVKVTTQTGTYAFLNVAGSTDDVCNKTVTASGSSIVLTSVKNGTDGKQVRVTAIEVVYKAK